MFKKIIIFCVTIGLVMLLASSSLGSTTDELFKAVQSQSSTPEQIRTLIRAGANPNAEARITITHNGRSESNKGTVLMAACANNSNPNIAGIVRTLIDEGASPWAAVYGDKAVALMTASGVNSNPELVRIIVEAGVDVNTKIESGATALMSAVLNNTNPEVINMLLRLGADISIKDRRRRTVYDYADSNKNFNMRGVLDNITKLTAELFEAVQDSSTSPERIRGLIRDGANLRAVSSLSISLEGKNNTFDADVLIAACAKNNNPEIIRTLLESGADINTNIKHLTPLQTASAMNPNPEVIRVLIDAGADPNAKTDGILPLMLAAGLNPNPEIARTLIMAGADMDALNITEVSARNPNPEVRNVLNELADTSRRIKALREELFKAVQDENATPEQIQALIDGGANIRMTSEITPLTGEGSHVKINATPLEAAVLRNNNPEIIKVLVKAGSDVNRKDTTWFMGITPLMLASGYGVSPAVVQALIDSGADVNARHKEGANALTFAVSGSKNLDIVKVLAEAGANYRLVMKDGKSIKDSGTPEINEYLNSLR